MLAVGEGQGGGREEGDRREREKVCVCFQGKHYRNNLLKFWGSRSWSFERKSTNQQRMGDQGQTVGEHDEKGKKKKLNEVIRKENKSE